MHQENAYHLRNLPDEDTRKMTDNSVESIKKILPSWSEIIIEEFELQFVKARDTL